MRLNNDRLAAAKLWLISLPPGETSVDSPRDLPYLAHALYALIPVASAEVKRMTCDEWWRIYVNSDWLEQAPIPEVGAELAHMTWHLLADHTGRARDQDVDRTTAKPWNTAADIAVAHTLAADELGVGALPTAVERHLPRGRSAEEYFAMISKLPTHTGGSGGTLDPTEGCGSGADGITRSHEFAPGTDVGAVSTFDAHDIRRRVAIDYREGAKKRGRTPGDLLRWVEETLDPKVQWESLLSGAVRRAVGWSAGRGDYTYRKPSRRASSNPGIVLPGQHRPIPRLSIIVDTSGSVDDELLARALGEVDGAISALGVPGSNVTVYSVDAAVHVVRKVRRARDTHLVGGGGTDLRLGLRAAQDEKPRPDVIIVFTDGGTPWPADPPPGAVVIAAILGHQREALPLTPTWVTRVECVLDN